MLHLDPCAVLKSVILVGARLDALDIRFDGVPSPAEQESRGNNSSPGLELIQVVTSLFLRHDLGLGSLLTGARKLQHQRSRDDFDAHAARRLALLLFVTV